MSAGAGSIAAGAKVLAERSVIRVEPDDPILQLQAGKDGAQILGLQFAAPSDRPGTDPIKLADRAAQGYVNLRTSGT